MSKSRGTTEVQPWSGQQPYIKTGLSEALKLYQVPMSFFPGSTIADFTATQRQAQELMRQRALAGSPEIAAGSAELRSILGGKYLTPESNPYLSYYTKRAFEEALPQLDTSAIAAGRYGSGAWGLAKGRTMADLAGNIYGQAYEAERQRQLQAAQLAPAYSEAAWGDLARLAAVGEEQQRMEQAKINEAMERWQFGQLEPWTRLANYFNLIGGQYGGTTTSMRGK